MFNFRKIQTNNDALMQLQANADDVFKQLRNATILDGVLVKNVTIGTSATTISHTLGRQPVGYIIVDLDRDARIYRSAWNSKTMALVSSAPSTTISLWVF